MLGAEPAAAPAPPEAPGVELDNACVRAVRRLDAALDREAWDEVEQLFAAEISARESPEDCRLPARSSSRQVSGRAR